MSLRVDAILKRDLCVSHYVANITRHTTGPFRLSTNVPVQDQ